MSKKKLDELTFEDRARLAAQVKRLRQESGFTQADLAEMAGISRQALSNIERGSTPQIENLRKIYEVLGVDITNDADDFSEETSRWLSIVGGIMESMPADRRSLAGQAAVAAVTDELVAATKSSNVIHANFNRNDVVAEVEDREQLVANESIEELTEDDPGAWDA